MTLVTACRDAMARLTEASEGALSGAEKITYAFHLTVCPHCRRYRAQLDTTVKALRAIPREAPANEDISTILDLLSKAEPKT